MSSYHTEQKRILTDFLSRHRDESFTIDELTHKMQSECGEGGQSPARSTIYRLIDRLERDGQVRKFVKSNERGASYQFVAGGHCDSHLHLKCTGCGKLFHMEERVSDELIKKISNYSDFSVNEEETVLYGRCAVCNKK